MTKHVLNIMETIKSKFMKSMGLAAVFLLVFLGISDRASATHVMGADITYRCISNLKFEITVKYYRSCKGVSFSNPSSETSVRCVSGSGSASMSLSLKTIRDVTPVCSKEPSRCNPKNTWGTGEGIEEHEYVTTIDFNQSTYSALRACCKVRIQTGQCCRNSDITTGAADANFYTFAELDLCKAPCNTSPSLNKQKRTNSVY